ncbi:MAG: AAA domain-containing protein [Chloroflexota bacterium]
MSNIIYIDGLPPSMGNGSVLRLLIEVGGVEKANVGKIMVRDGLATVGVDGGQATRAVRKLDGAQVEAGRLRAWQQPDEQTADLHFTQLLRWLAQEAKAEQEQERRGGESHLQRLVVKDEKIGLGGMVLLQLQPRNEQLNLPWTPLTAGSPVLLREEGAKQGNGRRGVVTQKRRRMIEVALTYTPEPEGERPSFSLTLAHDAVARQRMERALSQIMAAKADRLAELRDILLGRQTAVFGSAGPIDASLLEQLNEVQKTAVSHAMSAQDVALIHGPPGTGKTTTLVAVVQAAVQRGERVLACAPSNMGVDNLALGLVRAGEKVVRLGHPARIQPDLLAHTLDALVAQQSDYQLAQKMRREAIGLQGQSRKWRRAKPERGAKQAMRQEAKELFDQARRLEAQAVEQVLDQTPIIVSTLTGLDAAHMGQRQFDLCVIDEAGQSVEPATWIPVPRSQRLVLAGDHQQLPPTILSRAAAEAGFGRSLLEQLMGREELAVQLTVQYRMHADIMGFSSTKFYEDSLIAHESVAGHLLAVEAEWGQTAVTFIDTAGAGYEELIETDTNSQTTGRSRYNPEEAALVVAQVEQMLAAGVGDIGVITPYAAQVRLLRNQLPDEVEISSVDGFQGREKEVIVISLVRSNNRGEIGFLAETRRMNVALTRARRKLLVIGDSATITAHPFYGRLVDYWEAIGAYHSVWELM